MEAGKDFNVYKGLQKPLVFRAFKGKFIYWGVGSVLIGLLATMIVSSLVSIWYGLLTLVIVLGGGLTYTGIMQKKGLHSKTKSIEISILPLKYHRNGQKKAV